jgi:hypothetical protein
MEAARENTAQLTRQIKRQAQREKQKETLRFMRKLKLEVSDEELSATAGIGPLLEVFQKSPLAKPLAECLPLRTGPKSLGSFRLSLVLLAGFLRGFDSVSDWEEFRQDPNLKALFDQKVPASRTLEDFFNDFAKENTLLLNQYLHSMAMSLRGHLAGSLGEDGNFHPIIWDIDATSHVQHGTKMEGVEKNYKGEMSLNSQSVFDEKGFCHGVQLRSGNVEKDSQQAVKLLEQVFAGFKFHVEKYLRGDSAYCTQELIKCCLLHGVIFSFTAHGNIGWENHIHEITNWKDWEYSDEEVRAAAKKGKKLPTIQVGSFHYRPGWNSTLMFQLVVKRTKKEKGQLTLVGQDEWDYYGVLTNMNLFKHSPQHVIEHHNGRGNCENMIKEGKHNFDLLHFSFLKMLANHGYLQMALVAQNLMRWMGLMTNPTHPPFAKKLRRIFLNVPGKLLYRSKQWTLRIPKHIHKEVVRMIVAWQATPFPALGFT